MKNWIGAVLIISLVIFVFYTSFGTPDSKTTSETQTQINEGEEVTVEATPVSIGNTAEDNVFHLSLNTHSVELDYDFVEIVTLEDDLGNEYRAQTWDGNSGWHHVDGNIIFPAVAEGAETLELIVSNVNGSNREFSWNLNI